jgi:hypothetical protein
MSTFDDRLWAKLVDEHGADRVASRPSSARRRARPLMLTASATVVAAATLAVGLGFSATTSTPPAYALTHNTDGSVTVTLHDLTIAIPALNAKFALMGIDETVIPVKAGCSMPGLVDAPGATMTESLTITPGRKYLAPGYDGVLAAEQLPDGKVALSVGAMKPPLPKCFSNAPATSFPPGSRGS